MADSATNTTPTAPAIPEQYKGPGEVYPSRINTGTTVRILVIDNYDSFVFTLVGYLRELGAEAVVIRNDEVTADAARQAAQQCSGILLSPGPGTPAEAGVSMGLVRWAAERSQPLYGVCLGQQAISEAYGATVTHAEELMHGKTSQLHHNEHPMFSGVPNDFTATRYHSLAAVRSTVDTDQLEITATTPGGVVMAVALHDQPVWGVQFHPESVLTEGGYQMLGNWLEQVGVPSAASRAAGRTPLMGRN